MLAALNTLVGADAGASAERARLVRAVTALKSDGRRRALQVAAALSQAAEHAGEVVDVDAAGGPVPLPVRLKRFYGRHGLRVPPEADVQAIAGRFASDDSELNKALRAKYGVDLHSPALGGAAAAAAAAATATATATAAAA
jgi:hypothetical protein